jgi:dolichol-phosphate mannosyltransferase
MHGLGAFRRLMSRGAAAVARLFLPLSGVTDFTSGYRAYRGEVLRRARDVRGGVLVDQRGFAVTMELLAATAAVGARFAEVPLALRYERKVGTSKMQVGRTILATLGVLWRARRWRAAP